MGNENKPMSIEERDALKQQQASAAGVKILDHSLQRKFNKGVRYNMKLLIRGDRMVGKSCLLQRLQGMQFNEEYSPTEEIQIAHIHWSYKTTSDSIKVEVWDVVDKGKKSKTQGIKMSNLDAVNTISDASLDAEFVDVYQGAHSVILMFDLTKRWTWDYVQRSMPEIPSHLPILILGNRRDECSSMKRVVTLEEVQCLIDLSPKRLEQIRFVETSMKDGFGLRYIYRFFNLPFLQLQRNSLMQQIEQNAHETQQVLDELEQSSEEQDYTAFTSHRLSKLNLSSDVSITPTPVGAPDSLMNAFATKSPTSKIEQTSSILKSSEASTSEINVNGSELLKKDSTAVEDFYAGTLDDDFFDDDVGNGSKDTNDIMALDSDDSDGDDRRNVIITVSDDDEDNENVSLQLDISKSASINTNIIETDPPRSSDSFKAFIDGNDYDSLYVCAEENDQCGYEAFGEDDYAVIDESGYGINVDSRNEPIVSGDTEKKISKHHRKKIVNDQGEKIKKHKKKKKKKERDHDNSD